MLCKNQGLANCENEAGEQGRGTRAKEKTMVVGVATLVLGIVVFDDLSYRSVWPDRPKAAVKGEIFSVSPLSVVGKGGRKRRVGVLLFFFLMIGIQV